ncbi:unnamed protein product [Adineta steineri]|uniref:Uncharacterized protein n=1 Tax=Adineta steineri TaxID=433720 RepID=A0A815GT92_9BILA|nr:unnamed protein product [Adineta steineri]CAF1594523.1 unnamed protein product [Adineta steineri]
MNIDNNNQETLKAPNEDIQDRPNEILPSIHIFTPQQQQQQQQRLNQDELCTISSGIKSPEIDQYHESYLQQQVKNYETRSDGDIKWLEDDYKEHIKQIEHVQELKEEEKQQYQLKLSKQLEDTEQWEEMLLQNLITLSEKQSKQINQSPYQELIFWSHILQQHPSLVMSEMNQLLHTVDNVQNYQRSRLAMKKYKKF